MTQASPSGSQDGTVEVLLQSSTGYDTYTSYWGGWSTTITQASPSNSQDGTVEVLLPSATAYVTTTSYWSGSATTITEPHPLELRMDKLRSSSSLPRLTIHSRVTGLARTPRRRLLRLRTTKMVRWSTYTNLQQLTRRSRLRMDLPRALRHWLLRTKRTQAR